MDFVVSPHSRNSEIPELLATNDNLLGQNEVLPPYTELDLANLSLDDNAERTNNIDSPTQHHHSTTPPPPLLSPSDISNNHQSTNTATTDITNNVEKLVKPKSYVFHKLKGLLPSDSLPNSPSLPDFGNTHPQFPQNGSSDGVRHSNAANNTATTTAAIPAGIVTNLRDNSTTISLPNGTFSMANGTVNYARMNSFSDSSSIVSFADSVATGSMSSSYQQLPHPPHIQKQRRSNSKNLFIRNSFKTFKADSPFTLQAHGIKNLQIVLSSNQQHPHAKEISVELEAIGTLHKTKSPADVRWFPNGLQIRHTSLDNITCYISVPKGVVESHPGIQINSRYGSLRVVGEIGAPMPPLTVSAKNGKTYLSILESTKLSISGTSGDMWIRDVTCKGRLTMACLDGAINVEEAGIGKLSLQTQTGSILLESITTMQLSMKTPQGKWMGEWIRPTVVEAKGTEDQLDVLVNLSRPHEPFRVFIAEKYEAVKLRIAGPFDGMLDMKTFRGVVEYIAKSGAIIPKAHKTIDQPKHQQVFFGDQYYSQLVDWNSHGGKATVEFIPASSSNKSTLSTTEVVALAATRSSASIVPTTVSSVPTDNDQTAATTTAAGAASATTNTTTTADQ
ncbi:hypothetical protein H4219_004939 [Mycoemilia scoparia]|uniref:Adhesin domain-containing protein n=1 Tax=Mycoemilia scoparia TaxID=417184 RepID=A0A9W8DQI3_9FUNG|nr:hypothetical protein H4219_004939 [Mycoemilia scoparia]